jgi:hypothetical protein
MAELSQTSPDLLMLQVMPCSLSKRWNCSLVYWVISSGCRNISLTEVLYGTTARMGYGADRTGTDAVARPAGCQPAGS